MKWAGRIFDLLAIVMLPVFVLLMFSIELIGRNIMLSITCFCVTIWATQLLLTYLRCHTRHK